MGIQQTENDDGSVRMVNDADGRIVQYADSTSRAVMTKFATIARTDTATKNLFTLAKNAQIVDVTIYVGTASNATSTATVSVGNSTTAGQFINGQDVKGTSGKVRPTTAVANAFAQLSSTTATQITGIYAETSAGSSTSGGPFTVQVDFVVPEGTSVV